jgi:hypothetical protein
MITCYWVGLFGHLESRNLLIPLYFTRSFNFRNFIGWWKLNDEMADISFQTKKQISFTALMQLLNNKKV